MSILDQLLRSQLNLKSKTGGNISDINNNSSKQSNLAPLPDSTKGIPTLQIDPLNKSNLGPVSNIPNNNIGAISQINPLNKSNLAPLPGSTRGIPTSQINPLNKSNLGPVSNIPNNRVGAISQINPLNQSILAPAPGSTTDQNFIQGSFDQTSISIQSTIPINNSTPVIEYGYNLVELPYGYPTSGNIIFTQLDDPNIEIGTTNPNTFAINGVYWNAIDNLGVDRTSYFNGMARYTATSSVTVYFTQNGDTAIYNATSMSFFYNDTEGSLGFAYTPFVNPEDQIVLIQSSSANFVIDQPVYIRYEINSV